MKYKVGDRVRIRKWNDMLNEFGLTTEDEIDCNGVYFVGEMREYCGKVVTISKTHCGYHDGYYIRESTRAWIFTECMIKCKVEFE